MGGGGGGCMLFLDYLCLCLCVDVICVSVCVCFHLKEMPGVSLLGWIITSTAVLCICVWMQISLICLY